MPDRYLGRQIGKYRVIRLLGGGAFAWVYEAIDRDLEIPVALKILRPEFAGDDVAEARFRREASTAAKLRHPNIVVVRDVGQIEGASFVAMDLLSSSLGHRLHRTRKLPEAEVIRIGLDVAAALGAAHAAGVIHRDIKPDNILFGRADEAIVADFGLARALASDLALSKSNQVMGTPHYFSPEQARGLELDGRSDLYSLGVTFYHMLAGKPPFQADTAVALALKHVRDQPASLAVHRPDLPPALVSLVMKLLQKDPKDRYPSAGEMLKDLAKVKENVQAGTSGMATINESPILAAAVAPTLAAPVPKAARPRPEFHWSPGVRTFLAIGTAFAVGGAVWGWMARANDMLGEVAPVAKTAPALWMANWEAIPKQPTAPAQYRFAQTKATGQEGAAAWLAVPARFPKESDWAWSSYLQMARHALRQEDAGSLDTLSRELKEAEARSGAAREKWLSLARYIHAGALAIQGETGEVIATFGTYSNTAAMDPALAAFCLEVLWQASRHGSKKEADMSALTQIRNQLLVPLKISPTLFDLIKTKPN